MFDRWKVPLAIAGSALLTGLFAWVGITQSVPDEVWYIRPVMIILTAMQGFVTVMLLIGYFAARAGYTRAELEREGEAALKRI